MHQSGGRLFAFVGVIVGGALLAAACVGTTTETTIPETTSSSVAYPVPDGEAARVISVKDGDTIVVSLDGGKEENVRLVGINTPEKGECFADEATRRLEDLVAGRDVLLSTDVNDRDQYGRLLRYVWTDDGFVNGMMVEEGLALARRYEPDTALADLLDAAQADAKSRGFGLWAPDACGAETGTGVAISGIKFDAPGNDGENLNGEWITVKNRGSGAVDLSGWMIKDESSSHRYAFPDGFKLAEGATVTVYTGCGDDTDDELYWCEQGSAVWNNSGDTGFLLDPSGNIVDTYSYGG